MSRRGTAKSYPEHAVSLAAKGRLTTADLDERRRAIPDGAAVSGSRGASGASASAVQSRAPRRRRPSISRRARVYLDDYRFGELVLQEGGERDPFRASIGRSDRGVAVHVRDWLSALRSASPRIA